ncbi:MAG: SDR family NAD(P)-dependent oxidoreductase [Bacteroidetes bacterium]|nr:SDR family NAD(P)-dependent oxidoreductase [Bacteroidota bacterium]
MEKIDVLVNNAGLASGLAAIQDGELSDWETMIDTNVKDYFMSQSYFAIYDGKKKRTYNQYWIHSRKEAYARGNVYCATKHAVDALSKSMRIDLFPFGIKVTCH